MVYLLCGVAILYSLMISLASTSIWLGRNQTLYDFWFYITNFARYPMEIYQARLGHAAVGVLHVRRAGAGRGQRAGPHAGSAAASAEQSQLAAGRVCAVGRRSSSLLALAVGFQTCVAELSQCQQLTCGATARHTEDP